MLKIVAIIAVCFLTSFYVYSTTKLSKNETEFRKKQLDYLDQILKKMR